MHMKVFYPFLSKLGGLITSNFKYPVLQFKDKVNNVKLAEYWGIESFASLLSFIFCSGFNHILVMFL